MKNKIIFLIITIILIITTVLLLIFKDSILKEQKNSDFIKVADYQNPIIENDYVLLKNIDEHNQIFEITQLTEEDFVNHNYLLFSIQYNECSEKDITPISYSLINKTLTINIEFNKSCDTCNHKYAYFFLTLDKDISFDDVSFTYKANNDILCPYEQDDKPIIYLYPKKEMHITIKLMNENVLTTTYPKYHNNWDIYAYPNGDLIDNNTDRQLYALYWEGNNHYANVMEDGFVIRGKDTISFLEEKLHLLGLTDREADEFIIYWLPKMEHNKYNYIRFETMEEINHYMPISINPIPDSIIRIQMDFKPLDKPINVQEQEIISPQREGFTVVEWGGSIIK